MLKVHRRGAETFREYFFARRPGENANTSKNPMRAGGGDAEGGNNNILYSHYANCSGTHRTESVHGNVEWPANRNANTIENRKHLGAN